MSATMTEEQHHPMPTRRRALPRALAAVAVAGVMAATFAGVRAVRSSSDPASAGAAATAAPRMPSSTAIEDTFGVRFDSVVLTASGGMLELRYTVLDDTKAAGLHDQLPYVVTASGAKLDQPGIAGHGGHQKSTADIGAGEYNLLANIGDVVRSGSVVTIRVGDLALPGVVVQ